MNIKNNKAMEEMIKKVCKFKDPLTNALACLIVADMFMGNTISKNKKTTINKHDMTRLYGFNYNWVNGCVIGFGKRCLCFRMYLAKVTKRRLKGYCYVTKSEGVVFNMKYNCDKLRFFGFISIDKKDLMD